MAFGGFARTGDATPLAEINMVPLIDVMLVLLVIFIVTAPLLTHAVKIDLPHAASTPNLTRPEHVNLAIDAGGHLFWNGEAVSRDALASRLAEAAHREQPPEVHIRADRATPYQNIAEVLAAAAKQGVTRIGFVSDPRDVP